MMYFPVTNDFTNQLPFYYLGIGYNYAQEHVIRPGGRPETEWSHRYYQMIQCVKGTGLIDINDVHYKLHEGQILFLVPNEAHEYYALTDNWVVNWIIFSGSGISHFVRNTLNIRHTCILSLSSSQAVSQKVERLYNSSISSHPLSTSLCSNLIYGILLDLYYLSSHDKAVSIGAHADKLAPVFEYIHTHYHEPIELSRLAAIVGITPQYLCVSFKTLTSHSVFSYIMIYRIQKSKELLLINRSLPIKDIALRCGFNDTSYFCSIFKKYELTTPNQFRKNN